MKEHAHSMLFFAIIGIGIGIPVTLACMALIGGVNEVIREFLIWTVASALFGMISGLVFTHVDGLPWAMLLHCSACLIVAVGAVVLCGYADSFLMALPRVLPVFVIVYILVYAFCVFGMKLEEKRINQALNKE